MKILKILGVLVAGYIGFIAVLAIFFPVEKKPHQTNQPVLARADLSFLGFTIGEDKAQSLSNMASRQLPVASMTSPQLAMGIMSTKNGCVQMSPDSGYNGIVSYVCAMPGELSEFNLYFLNEKLVRIDAKVNSERASDAEAGQPTPVGMHRDGLDWVHVLLVRRVNVQSGDTTIGDLRRRPLGSFTLTDPHDAAVTDDNRVYHGVTPVTPLHPDRPGHRDVLVVTFRRE